MLALLPVLLGTAACGSGTEEAPGEAVYGVPLAQQFHAATAATREAGTSRFLATLTYATSGAKTVERASGTQDYAARTSSATHELHIPADFPEKDAGYIGEAARVAVATAGDDVYVRRDDSSWLRYSPAAFTVLGDGAEELSVHAAGEVAPWSGTLADLVPRSVPGRSRAARRTAAVSTRSRPSPRTPPDCCPRPSRSAPATAGATSRSR
ncbi:hypothetical protein ACFQ60_39810 [Streptomyces zhihengii]